MKALLKYQIPQNLWPKIRRFILLPFLFSSLLIPPAFLTGCQVKACSAEEGPVGPPPDWIWFGDAQNPINLVMWYTFEDAKVMEALAAEYQIMHPYVTITTIPQRPFGEYIDQLGLKSGTDKAPDIYYIRNDWLPLYSGKLIPMPEKNYIRSQGGQDQVETPEEYVDLFMPALKQDFFLQKTEIDPNTGEEKQISQLYGIPWGHEGVGLFVNLDHIDQYNRANPTQKIATPIPTETITWEQFNAMSQKLIKARDNWVPPSPNPEYDISTIEHFGAAFGNSVNIQHFPEMLSTMIMQYNVQIVSEDHTTVNFIRGDNITATVRAVEDFAEYDNYWNQQWPSSMEAFSQELVSLAFGKSYQLAGIESRNINFDVIPIPQRSASDTTQWVTPSYYWARVVNRDTKHPEIAWDFLKWVASKETMKFYSESTQIPPARLDLSDSDGELTVTLNSKRYSPFLKALPYAQSWYKGDPQAAEQALQSMIININNGKDVQNELTEFAIKLEKIIQGHQVEQYIPPQANPNAL